LLVLLLFFTSAIGDVTAIEEDTPVVEEVSFTDGGTVEIDTLEMALPINYLDGDLLVMVMVSDNPQDATYFNAVSNWTKLDESGTSVADSHIAVYYRIANETILDVTVTGVTTSNMLGWILRLSGVDLSDPIEAYGFAASTAGGTNPHQIPSITTINDNCLVLYGLAFDGGDGFPFSVVSPFIELSERANGGAPLEAYVSGTIGYRDLIVSGSSGYAIVYTDALDGASYFQLAINGDIETEATVGSGILYELFLSTSIWGYFGPLGLIVAGYFFGKKDKMLGVLFFAVECLVIAQYLALVEATPAYWWHSFIVIFGMLFTIIPILMEK
jgi:hypothetical protein